MKVAFALFVSAMSLIGCVNASPNEQGGELRFDPTPPPVTVGAAPACGDASADAAPSCADASDDARIGESLEAAAPND